jgi:hypothetical protein
MSSTATSKPNNSQTDFFTDMTDSMLNEFLHRIDDGTLAAHITTQMIANHYGYVKVQPKITDVSGNISAYINITYMGKQRLHITLHLTSNDLYNKRTLRALHIRNNTRKAATPVACYRTTTLRKRLYVESANRNTPRYTRITNPAKKAIINIIMRVISNYIDPSHSYYLEYTLTPSSNIIHPYLMPIIHARKRTKAPIKQTALTL